MHENNCGPLGCYNPFHDHEDEARLSRLVRRDDPAFEAIVELLTDMATGGVEFTPAIIEAASKAGRARHARLSGTPSLPHQDCQEMPTGPVVYYFRRGRLIKIGTTVALKRRMTELMPDEVLAIEPGGEDVERSRHRQFRSLVTRPRGEYFFPGPDLLGHISQVRADHGAPPRGLPSVTGTSPSWVSSVAETDRIV